MLRVFFKDEVFNNKEYKLENLQTKPDVEITSPQQDLPIMDKPPTYYTLMMVDPDAPSKKDPIYKYVLHWLIVNIKGQIEVANEIVPWKAPSPGAGSGDHRYEFILFTQPEIFDEKYILQYLMPQFWSEYERFKYNKFMDKTRLKFSVNDFVSKHNLEWLPDNKLTIITRKDVKESRPRHKKSAKVYRKRIIYDK